MQMTDRHLVEGTTPKITIGHRAAKETPSPVSTARHRESVIDRITSGSRAPSKRSKPLRRNRAPNRISATAPRMWFGQSLPHLAGIGRAGSIHIPAHCVEHTSANAPVR